MGQPFCGLPIGFGPGRDSAGSQRQRFGPTGGEPSSVPSSAKVVTSPGDFFSTGPVPRLWGTPFQLEAGKRERWVTTILGIT